VSIIRGRGKAIKYPTYVRTSRGAPATRKRNIRRRIALQQLGGMGNLVTFIDYLSGNAGRDVSVTSQRLHVKEKDFLRNVVCIS
jgi:hypothetical protein